MNVFLMSDIVCIFILRSKASVQPATELLTSAVGPPAYHTASQIQVQYIHPWPKLL